MKKKILLCSSLIISLTSCSRYDMDISEDIPGYQSQEKGILIIQHVNIEKNNKKFILKSQWLNKDTSNSFSIGPKNFIYHTSLNGTPYSSSSLKEIMILFVEPGNYTLEKIIHNKLKHNINKIINFSINGGEIVYVGNLTLNLISPIESSVEDFYENACDTFKKIYPQIKAVPKKRLMEFSEKFKFLQNKHQDFKIAQKILNNIPADLNKNKILPKTPDFPY